MKIYLYNNAFLGVKSKISNFDTVYRFLPNRSFFSFSYFFFSEKRTFLWTFRQQIRLFGHFVDSDCLQSRRKFEIFKHLVWNLKHIARNFNHFSSNLMYFGQNLELSRQNYNISVIIVNISVKITKISVELSNILVDISSISVNITNISVEISNIFENITKISFKI